MWLGRLRRRLRRQHCSSLCSQSEGGDYMAEFARAESPISPEPRATPWVPCSPFPTPCKGKSNAQPFAHAFALTGRRRLYTDTQGVALGCGVAALSGRSCSPNVPCGIASPYPLRHASPNPFLSEPNPFHIWIEAISPPIEEESREESANDINEIMCFDIYRGAAQQHV